jgi:membrane-associated phospholipid phosphatase
MVFLMAVAVGSARLVLRAHKPEEVYGGYLIGIASQLLAIRIFF